MRTRPRRQPFRMRIVQVLLGACLLTGASAWGCSGGTSPAATSTGLVNDGPAQSLVWMGSGGGFGEWGCTGDSLWATSVKPKRVEAWQWENGRLKKDASFELGDNVMYPTFWMGEGRYLAVIEEGPRLYTYEWHEDKP